MTKLGLNTPCIRYAPRHRLDKLPWVLQATKRRRLVLARGATPSIVYGAALGLLHERKVRLLAFKEREAQRRGFYYKGGLIRRSSLDEDFQ